MKTSRIVQLPMFAMVVSGCVETAFASPVYSFTTIDVPGGSFTEAVGINNRGQIVGAFNDASGGHGFLDTGGSFTTIDVPGAGPLVGTVANGINDSGQIVGEFQDATGTHGFLAAPVPEPPTSLTLATSLVALYVMARHRKRASAGNLER